MAVFLAVLKVIGIALLAALGLAVFLVLLILFVPVRYSAKGVVDGKIDAHGKVSWLFCAVSYRFSYEKEGFRGTLRIFGVPLRGKKKAADGPDTENADEDGAEAEDSPAEGSSADLAACGYEPLLTEEERETSEARDGEDGETKKAFLWIKEFLTSPKEKRGGGKFARIRELLADDSFLYGIKKIRAELCYLLRHFGFRKIAADARFSAGDPALTGQALGVLSMLPFLYRRGVSIAPDFEADGAYFTGTFAVRGRLRLVHLAASLLRIIPDEEMRIFIKKVNNIRKGGH